MKLIHILPLVLTFITVFACKQETSPTETASETPATNETAASETNPNLVANMSWTFLTDQLFHHGVTVSSGNVDENERKGHWVDFHDNGKYDYGVWGDKTLEGNWAYDEKTQLLEMRPSDGGTPSEWRLMHKDDRLIMVGTAKFANNTQQVQWVRNALRPAK